MLDRGRSLLPLLVVMVDSFGDRIKVRREGLVFNRVHGDVLRPDILIRLRATRDFRPAATRDVGGVTDSSVPFSLDEFAEVGWGSRFPGNLPVAGGDRGSGLTVGDRGNRAALGKCPRQDGSLLERGTHAQPDRGQGKVARGDEAERREADEDCRELHVERRRGRMAKEQNRPVGVTRR